MFIIVLRDSLNQHARTSNPNIVFIRRFYKQTQYVGARARNLLRDLNYIVHLSRIQQKRLVETKGAMETCARAVAKRRSGRGSAGVYAMAIMAIALLLHSFYYLVTKFLVVTCDQRAYGVYMAILLKNTNYHRPLERLSEWVISFIHPNPRLRNG